ncbi:MAG: NAD(P)(+) transhydrogenase (Re/Si-specific) subunit beta, partial [Acidobacteriota bacterium]
MNIAIQLIYVLAALLFGLGLKLLCSPATARRGNLWSAFGMFLAVVATLFYQGIIDFRFIAIGIIIGSIIGILAARFVAMTAMPEMVGLLNGFGGIASLLVGWAEYHGHQNADTFSAVTIFLTVLIGGVTFSGSVLAWAKLKEIRFGSFRLSKALVFRGQQIFNSLLLLAILACGVLFIIDPINGYSPFIGFLVLSFVLGIMAVIPIGGADMPVVISLLNSYSGMAACAAGFVILNNILIVAGALVGASGIILTSIMCKAMNRS